MSARDWLGKTVDVFAGFDVNRQGAVIAHGEVIAVIESPCVIVRNPNGGCDAWPITLPIEEAAEQATR